MQSCADPELVRPLKCSCFYLKHIVSSIERVLKPCLSRLSSHLPSRFLVSFSWRCYAGTRSCSRASDESRRSPPGPTLGGSISSNVDKVSWHRKRQDFHHRCLFKKSYSHLNQNSFDLKKCPYTKRTPNGLRTDVCIILSIKTALHLNHPW